MSRPPAASASPRRRIAPGQSGFTLIELLAVMTVIGIMLGIGIGFLQRGTTLLDTAQAVLRDQMQVAATSARARAVPGEVRVVAQAAGPTLVRAQLLGPLAVWHLEPDERWLNSAHRPDLSGIAVPTGRFGSAWRPDPTSKAPMLSVRAGTWLDVTHGFLLRLDLRLDERRAAVAARLGRAWTLGWDDELRPTAKLTLAGGGGRAGAVVDLRGERPLPVGRWLELRLLHDGTRCALLVDGVELASAPAPGEPFQQSADLLEVSGGDAPVLGLVDEILLMRYELGDELRIAPEVGVALRGPAGRLERVRFDRLGAPEQETWIDLTFEDETLRGRIGAAGVIRWER
jgi:prepilin-type N-terminal cleavage/methylation domain-containing protein